MNRKTLTSKLVMLLMVSQTLLAGCGLESQSTEQEPLKVAALPFLSFSPFFIADAEGYFDDEKLDVEFIRFERGADAIASLVSGEIDIWAGAVSASLLNAIQRSSIQVVADRGYFRAGDCGYTAFLVRKELVENGAVTSPSDLADLKFVNEGEGDMRHYFMEQLLAMGGLSINDVEIVSIPDPVMIDAFSEGSIDVAGAGEPWVARISAAGDAVDWLAFEDVVPDFQFGVIAFGPNLLENQPELGDRFLRAFLKAVETYNEGKTERNVEIIAEATGLEPEILLEACWPAYQADGRINVDSIMAFQDWLVANNYLETRVAESTFWNGSYLNRIQP